MPPVRNVILFFLINLFLCSWHLDGATNDATMTRALTVNAIVEHGNLEISEFEALTGDKAVVDGHYFTDKAPLPAFVVTPFWWLARRAGAPAPDAEGSSWKVLLMLGGFLCGSLPLALIITLLWQEFRASRSRWPAMFATLPLYGSFLFVYSGSFYNHVPGALFVLLSAMAIRRARWLSAGLWCGAALLTDTALIVIVAVQGAQLLFSAPFRNTARFAAGAIGGLILLLLYNSMITGSPFVFPSAMAANYPHMTSALGFRGWSFSNLLGLTFGTWRGLFVYMPALLALVLVRDPRPWRSLTLDPLLLPAIALILTYAGHSTWWGGWTYGPRYITASALLLLVYMITHLSRWKGSGPVVLILALPGFLLAWAAKSTVWYSLPTDVDRPITAILIPTFMDGRWAPWQWPMQAGLPPTLVTMSFPVVLALGLLALHHIDRNTLPDLK